MSASSKGSRVDTNAVLENLARILDSAPFRSSKQCQDLLRYVVEHSLRDDNEALKERVIGCEVFGRRPDYDTAEDPVVRNRAGDVRKRLALFYQSMPSDTHIKLDIPHGSYRVEFHSLSEPGLGQDAGNSSHGLGDTPGSKTKVAPEARANDAPSPPTTSGTAVPSESTVNLASASTTRPHWFSRNRIWIPVTLVVIAALSFAIYRPIHSPKTAFDEFWNPIVASPTPPVICVAGFGVYRYRQSGEYGKPTSQGAPDARGIEKGQVGSAHPGEKFTLDDLILDQNNFVAVGDAAAYTAIVSMLSSERKPYDLRFSNDLAFGDLRRSPNILIGAFNNSWTLEMDDKLPFVFDQLQYIREVASPGRKWSTVRDDHGKATEDYALVSRLLHSKTGELSITLAGIDMSGTRASGEFVSDPDKLNQALKQLPLGWQGKNLQLLLHSTIINGLPSSTDVVAYRVW
jgi:hypothetical protein